MLQAPPATLEHQSRTPWALDAPATIVVPLTGHHVHQAVLLAGEAFQRARQFLAVQDENHALLLGYLLQGSLGGFTLGQCLCQQPLALGGLGPRLRPASLQIEIPHRLTISKRPGGGNASDWSVLANGMGSPDQSTRAIRDYDGLRQGRTGARGELYDEHRASVEVLRIWTLFVLSRLEDGRVVPEETRTRRKREDVPDEDTSGDRRLGGSRTCHADGDGALGEARLGTAPRPRRAHTERPGRLGVGLLRRWLLEADARDRQAGCQRETRRRGAEDRGAGRRGGGAHVRVGQPDAEGASCRGERGGARSSGAPGLRAAEAGAPGERV